jgi:serine-type D-Ala-D-Ala carboxypeptidase (penicillin-binding protein 5/6)
MILRRLATLCIISAILFFPVALRAAAAPQPPSCHSSILMDMTSGRTLSARNADAPIQPASITKILTLYLADEAIREGRVQPGDPVKISRQAWRTGGSKMFIEAGSEIPLAELLKGVAVVSANDAAVAVAEYIEGSVQSFVERMNQKARDLGMTRSVFRNPNGLPAKGQVTTARDMLILAHAYLQRFPESLDIHSQQAFTHGNITQPNRNALLQSYPDVDGLKTGWVSAAGYHIVVTAKRDQTRLIAVVMGARTPGIRNREAERLLDEGFRFAGQRRG